MTTGIGDDGTDSVGLGALGAGIGYMPASWDLEADVVVIGAGATGLPAAIHNPYQATPMDGAVLEATVARYNAFVDAGTDADFGKPTPHIRSRRRRSTPPGPRRWCTTRAPACGSTRSARC